MSTLPPLVEPAAELTRAEIARYARNLTLPEIGMTGQLRLKNARALVIGAGGLGSPALQYLAAAGVGTIGIVDDDVVSIANLQRQVVHGTEEVGRPKTETAAEAVHRINPLVTVQQHPFRLTAQNAVELVSEYDLVLDGADNFGTRYLVSDACVLAQVPCVWGSILRFDGQVSVFWAGHGPTYRDLHPDPPEPGQVPNCADGGVLGVLPGSIGAVMVTEAIKVITGIGRPLVGRILLHDALDMTWREIALRADPDAAPVTSVSDPTLAGPDVEADGPAPHEVLTAAELADLLARREHGTASFTLVDVREEWERELVQIPGSVPIALDELLTHGADALPPATRGENVILHCKSGSRSATALAALRAHYAGREASLRHLDGGVRAWVRDVDPDLTTY